MSVRGAQLADAERGKEKRDRVQEKGERIAELSNRNASDKCPNRQCHPAGSLGQRIRRVQFVVARNDGQNCGAAARKERRCQHQERTEHVQRPSLSRAQREDEPERDDTANKIAGYHDPPSIETVEQNAG